MDPSVRSQLAMRGCNGKLNIADRSRNMPFEVIYGKLQNVKAVSFQVDDTGGNDDGGMLLYILHRHLVLYYMALGFTKPGG